MTRFADHIMSCQSYDIMPKICLIRLIIIKKLLCFTIIPDIHHSKVFYEKISAIREKLDKLFSTKKVYHTCFKKADSDKITHLFCFEISPAVL